MFETHPKTSQQPLARRAQLARQAEALTYTPREQEIMHARRILEVVHTPEEMDAMSPAKLISDAEGFEDRRGEALTGLTN